MSIPIFQYRNTYITVNQALPECQQPYVLMDRKAPAIGVLGGDEAKTNVHHVPGIGWQLKSYQFNVSKIHEKTVGQSGIQTVASGDLTVAASHEEVDTFAQTSLVGVTFSGSPTTGSPMVRKGVAAGSSYNQALSADQTAYPSPNTSEEVVVMDRVAITAANHDPDEPITFRFFIPGHGIAHLTEVMTLYFCGPAGSDRTAIGIGQYALKLTGDGFATLFEQASVDGGALEWVKRYIWQWALPQDVRNGVHTITVTSDARLRGGSWIGSKIVFYSNAVANDRGELATLIALESRAAGFGIGGVPQLPTYNVPRLTNESTTVCPVRVDVRRDLTARFQVSKHIYPATGTLRDDVWSLEFPPYGNTTCYFEWYATLPGGSELDCRLFRADDDTEVTSTLEISDDLGGQRSCTLPDGITQYYFVFTWTAGTSNERTATLLDWRVIRAEVSELPELTNSEIEMREASPSVPKAAIERVSIQGPSHESNDEAASFLLHDFTAELTDLGYQGLIPVKIETSYDINDARSVLFRGFAQEVEVKSISEDAARSYPKAGYRTYSFRCVGQWLRIKHGLSPTRWNWGERDTNLPYKVTDAIDLMLRRQGVPSEMLDIPDDPTRFFAIDANDESLNIEPGSPIADVIAGWARDYLGGWIIYDGNCGDYGKYRLILPKIPPYNVVARFDTRHPGVGKVPHVSGSYGSTTVGSQTILHTFVRGGSFSWHIEPPEGNIVTCYGASSGAEQGGSAVQLTQRIVNQNSYNFAGLADSDPNYPSPSADNWDFVGMMIPIRVYDGSLSTQEAVDWVARRVFDYACHGQRVLNFEAPLLLITDSDDAEQTAPRPLRFYDIVEFYDLDQGDWVEYIVRRCDPAYEQDGFQFANYELVRSTVMDEIAAMNNARQFEGVLKTIQRVGQIAQGDTARTYKATQGAGDIARSKTRWHSLPETYSAEIQDTDPASPSFGAGIFVWGLDSVGSSAKVIGGAA